MRAATWAFLAVLAVGCVGTGALAPRASAPAPRPDPRCLRCARLHALEEVEAHVAAWRATRAGLVEVEVHAVPLVGRTATWRRRAATPSACLDLDERWGSGARDEPLPSPILSCVPTGVGGPAMSPCSRALPSVLLLALALPAALPLLADGAGAGSLLPPGAEVLSDGSVAVPLVGEGPAWNTPEVRRKAVEAGARGLAYDVEKDEAVLLAAYPSHAFIRPGTMILAEDLEGWCTLAFVFGQSSQVSTAGHCTHVGERVIAVAAPGVLAAFGNTTASVDGGVGDDWALIDVDFVWRWAVDADVAWWGGPCGSVTQASIQDVSPTLAHSGHGYAYAPGAGTPRVAALAGLDATAWAAVGFVAGGDSGSAIVTVGPIGSTEAGDADASACLSFNAALGIITHGRCTLWPCAVVYDEFYGTRITVVPGTVEEGDLLPLPLRPIGPE